MRACAGSLAGRQLCVDGKEHRATTPAGQRHALVRTVSVWVADAQRRFGQAQIGAKTNEKAAIPALLGILDVVGSVVTIDAIACQPSIVGQVLTRGADDVIALKKNAKTLYEQASKHLLARAVHLPAHRSQDTGHGRGEQRTVRSCQDLALLDACADWPGLRTLALVETERHTSRGVTHTQHLPPFLNRPRPGGLRPAHPGVLGRGKSIALATRPHIQRRPVALTNGPCGP